MCPVYEEFKANMRDESKRKPIKDLIKPELLGGEGSKEIVPRQIELANDLKIFDRFEEKGLISIKTLVMKNPEARSKQEEIFLVLFLRIKHT